jgi:hypothetical protein
MRFYLLEVLLAGAFRADQVRDLWQLGSVHGGVCGFEYRDPDLAATYARRPWRCVSWMAPAPMPRP